MTISNKKDVFEVIEDLTMINKNIISGVFKKYDYQYGKEERFFVNILKIIKIVFYGIFNEFKKESEKIKTELLFDASIKRLAFFQVYSPIIKLFPNTKWSLLVRSKEIFKNNENNKCIVLEQDRLISRYMTLNKLKFIYSIVSLRVRFGSTIPLNQLLLFFQEYLYYENLINSVEFKILISFRDSAISPTMFGILKKHNITLITIQHGFYPPNADTRKNMKFSYYDYLYTFSDMQSQVFLNTYQSKINNIISYGSALLNNKLNNFRPKGTYDICLIEQIGTEKYFKLEEFLFLLKVVLDFSQSNGLSVIYCDRYLRSEKLSNNNIINSRLDRVDDLLNRYDFIVRTNDSYQAIFDSHLTVTKSSTMGLEAIGMEKFVLICDFHGSTGMYPKDNRLFFVHDMTRENIICGLKDIIDGDVVFLNSELKKIKPYYMNANPLEYFKSIKYIISKNI